MAITLRDSAKNAVLDDGIAPTNGSPTLPTHQSGDLLLVFCYYSRNISPQEWASNTAGWELVARDYSSAGRDQAVGLFYKFATSSSETAPDLQVYGGATTGFDYLNFISCAYTGVDPNYPFEGTEVRIQTDEGDTPNSPGILTSSDNTRVLSYIACTHYVTTPSFTAPTGYTLIQENPATDYHDRCALADKAVATAGYEDPGLWSLSISPDPLSELASITIALRDASETTAPPAYFVGMNQEGAASISSVAIAVPDGTLDGDLLIAVANQINVAGRTTTPPSGWTEVTALDVDTTNGTHGNSEVYYREASGEDPQNDTYTWTWSGSQVSGVSILCYRGVNISGGPFDVTPVAGHVNEGIENDTTPQVPAITTNTDGAVLLNIWTGGTTGGGATGISKTGYQDIKNQNGATLSDAGRLNFGGVMGFLQKYQTTAGTEAAADLSLDNANVAADGSTRVIALLPKVEEVSATGTITFNTDNTVFEQDSGTDKLLVVDASEYSNKIDRGAHSWTDITDAGANDSTAIQPLPDNGTSIIANITTTAPQVDYYIRFTETGTHYFWVYGNPLTSGSDSLHAGLNDVVTLNQVTNASGGTPDGTWQWFNEWRDPSPNQSAEVTISEAGVYKLTIWMREDGVKLDRFLFTTNASYTPAGLGPSVSSKGLHLFRDEDTGIDATGTVTFTDTESLTSYHAVDATDTVLFTDTDSLTSYNAVAASDTAFAISSAALLGDGFPQAFDSVTFTDTASISSLQAVAATDGVVFTDTENLTSYNAIDATGSAVFTDTNSLTSYNAIDATGSVVLTDTNSLTSYNAIEATDTAFAISSAALIGTGSLVASGSIVFTDTDSLTSYNAIEATDTAFAISSAALLGSGSLLASGSVVLTDTNSLTSYNAIEATDTAFAISSAALIGTGSLVASGSIVFTDTDSLTSYNAIEATDTAFAISSAAILGTGSLVASAEAVFTVAANLGFDGVVDIDATGSAVFSETASLVGVIDAVATDDVLFTDVANGARTIFADASDSVVFSDSVTLTAKGFTSATADAVFTDSVTAVGEASIEATDSTVFTDNVVILGVGSASKSDSVVFTETGSLVGVSLTSATGQIVFLDSAEVESVAVAIASDTVVFTTVKSLAVSTKTPTPFERRSLNLLFRDGTRQTVERNVIEQIPISRKRRT